MFIKRLLSPLGTCILLSILYLSPLPALSAQYAALVMDARTGEVLHAENADTRLHPASLTKMMTLYIAFEAVRNGEIGLDTQVKISGNAAAEPPSKLGLRSGQSIALRYLIRAAAVKSANDAATAIGEAISGSEAAFARRMNRTAQAIGMRNTTFKNAHGLTESGHLSTARDMSVLGRQLFYDFPEYYNLFSRQAADAKIATVYHTNRRMLRDYAGADGIKTGYTRAAGFNLTASAERGGERIIATVFGGRSTATRNAKVAELLDLGFARAPSRVAVHKPSRPHYDGTPTGSVAVASSLRPMSRPTRVASIDPAISAGISEAVASAVAAAAAPVADAPVAPETVAVAEAVAEEAPAGVDVARGATIAALDAVVPPAPRPEISVAPAGSVEVASADPTAPIAIGGSEPQPETLELVTRLSTSGGRHWGVNVGRYTTRYTAEQELLKIALAEAGTLGDALRKVVQSPQGWEANFVGMTEDRADMACARLAARDMSCNTLGPN